MSKVGQAAPLLLVVGGLLLAYLAITGRLGIFLGAIFTPSEVQANG